MRSRASFFVRSCVFVLVGALAAIACSNLGEGGVCNQSLGNSDCQDGLVCRAPMNENLLTENGTYPWRCCPPIGNPSSVAECQESAQVNNVLDASSDATGTPVVDAGGTGSDGATGTDAGSADASDGATSTTDASDGAAPPDAADLDAADGASG